MLASQKPQPLSTSLRWASFLLIALGGALLIFYATRWGPVIFSDSAAYLLSARNWLAGSGFGEIGGSGRFHPLSLHPPLYAVLLGALGYIGIDLIAGARGLCMVFFAFFLLLTTAGVYRLTRSAWLGTAMSLIVLTSALIVRIYSNVLTETLYLPFSLATLLLLLGYFKSGDRRTLVWATVFTGLAFLTRFIGAGLVATGAIGLLLFQTKSWRQRLLDVLGYGLFSSIPVTFWLGQLYWQTHRVASRSLDFLGANLAERFQPFRLSTMELLWGWVPFATRLHKYVYLTSYNYAKVRFLAFGAIVAILMAVTIWKIQRGRQSAWHTHPSFRLGSLLILFALANLSFIAATYIFATPLLDLTHREYAPVYWGLLFGLLAWFDFMLSTWFRPGWMRSLVLIPALVVILSEYPITVEMVASLHEKGDGYVSQSWQNSAMIQAIRQLPPDLRIVSNEATAVTLLTGRPCYAIRELEDADHLETFVPYGSDANDEAQTEFRERGAALLLFDWYYWQFWPIYEGETDARLAVFLQGLVPYHTYADGAIYFYSEEFYP